MLELKQNNLIAVIDTGSSERDEVIARYSVIGDKLDDSENAPHGSSIINLILEQNPKARIISIKISNDGSSKAEYLYKAIKKAIELNVNIINISLSGPRNEKTHIVEEAINEAIEKGIVVVSCTSPYGSNADNYLPSGVKEVLAVAPFNEDGTLAVYSGIGHSVKYGVAASSTSGAAAILTGLLSKYAINSKNQDEIINGLILQGEKIFSTNFKENDYPLEESDTGD